MRQLARCAFVNEATMPSNVICATKRTKLNFLNRLFTSSQKYAIMHYPIPREELTWL